MLYSSGNYGRPSLGFGSVITRATTGQHESRFRLGFFFVDVAKSELLYHPVRLCETERFKYADIYMLSVINMLCFISSLP